MLLLPFSHPDLCLGRCLLPVRPLPSLCSALRASQWLPPPQLQRASQTSWGDQRGWDFPEDDLPGPAPAQSWQRRELGSDRRENSPGTGFSTSQPSWGTHQRERPRPKTWATMASALSPPRLPKPKAPLPSHYYESFLEKKGPCDRVRRGTAMPLLGSEVAGLTSLSLQLHTWPRGRGGYWMGQDTCRGL